MFAEIQEQKEAELALSLKVEAENPCPVCGEEIVRSVHVGKRRIVRILGDAGYKSVSADEEFGESGNPNYVDVVDSRGARFDSWVPALTIPEDSPRW